MMRTFLRSLWGSHDTISLRSLWHSVWLLGVVASTTVSCTGDFAHAHNPPRLVVTVATPDKTTTLGTLDQPLPIGIDTPFTYVITVSAVLPDGTPDTSFSRYVRISSKPGSIAPLVGTGTEGRNLHLQNGVSSQATVTVTNPFGTTYIVADDLGYVPADPLRVPPPACSNGVDDNGNGLVDFPADPGCAFANDDSEDGGTYTEGASNPIFFKLPRIADVRGLKCDPRLGCSGNGVTPYPRQQVLLDTGFRSDGTFAFDTVVTRIATNGYYITDLADTRGGFNSVFAFNFNAPPLMRVCDRLQTSTGTASEFFGFTQLSYPTWTLEEWEPNKRLCLVPEPEVLTPTTILDAPELLLRSANLVRVQSAPDGSEKLKVTPKFGAGIPKLTAGSYVFTADASNCDIDNNGKINSFNPGDPEGSCSTACTADPECTEYSNFVSRSTFRVTVTDSNGRSAAIQADATAAAGFDPVANKGKPLRSLTGTMSFFSGGAQYTIEVRCPDDILTSLNEAPFYTDKACTKDADCSVANGLPKGFTCTQLTGSPPGTRVMKGCRKVDEVDATLLDPPPLACVIPRTFLDENPQ